MRDQLICLDDSHWAVFDSFEGELLKVRLLKDVELPLNTPLKVSFPEHGVHLLYAVRKAGQDVYLYVPLRNNQILKDRRTYPRFPLPESCYFLPVKALDDEDFSPLYVSEGNVSLKGVAFKVAYELVPGESIVFHFVDGELAFSAVLKIVHATKLDDTYWRYGASFTKLPHDTMQKLRLFVLKLQLKYLSLA